MQIKDKAKGETINIALDTIERNKQALVFVNSKRGAEKTAEDIAKWIKKEKITVDPACLGLSQSIAKALSSPTKQCKRLADMVQYGVAFHHAGLVQKQKSALEDAFRNGVVKIICCTPTLAMGVDMPAYRAIIRDLKRFSRNWGMSYIPVLEYHQMAGRAGRPGKDTRGEAITIAKTEAEKDAIYEQYVIGEVEDVYSKLAVEPVLRMYLLSLISTDFVSSKKQIMDFFSKTFWAHQYQDLRKLETIVLKMLKKLIDWEFLQSDEEDFSSAGDLENTTYKATLLGRRVAELYLDPLTAHHMILGMRKATSKIVSPFTLLHLMCDQLELRPLLSVKKAEYEDVEEQLLKWSTDLLVSEPSTFDPDYDYFLRGIKTTMFFAEWIEEIGEDRLLTQFNVRPGELHGKKERMIWLLYASIELSKLLAFRDIEKELHKLKFRVEYGVKEELFAVLKLKGIGRVRARKLYNNKVRNLGDIKKIDVSMLAGLIGGKMALNIKKQVGIDVSKMVVKPKKRKGQMSLGKY
jgi:helicase